MTTPSLRFDWRYALLPCVMFCLLFDRGTSVSAHARLVESAPLSGSALDEMPGEILLYFSEPVAPTSVSLSLEDEAGTALGIGAIQLDDDDHRIRVTIERASAVAGTLQLRWSVRSASDGHDSAGIIAFTVGTGRAPLNIASTGDERDGWWQILVRTIWLLTLAIMAARVVRNLGVGPRPEAKVALGAGLAGLLAAMLLVRPWSEVGWDTSSARLQLIAGALGLVVALALIKRSKQSNAIAMVVWIAAVASLSASGHAAGVERSALATVILTIHSALALLWLGALIALVANSPTDAFPRWLSRYSRTAIGGVIALGVAGAVFVPFQITGQRALTESTYAKTLLIKLAIVLLVVAIAATNRWVVRPLVSSQHTNSIYRQARLGMAAELAVLSVVLCMAAVLSSTAPPDTQTITQVASPIREINQTASVAGLTIDLSASISGTVDDTFQVTPNPVGRAGDIQRVIVSTSIQDPQTGVVVPGERFDAEPDVATPGSFRFSALRLSQQAPWTLEVTVRRSGMLDATTAFTVDTSTWRAEQPLISDREWRWPVVPTSAWMLLALALVIPTIGLAVIRRNGQVAPLSGAILIIALTMITAGFAIQAWQRTSARTAGHDLTAPSDPDLVSAKANYESLCLACHGPDAAGIDEIDPLHQHGSGTNLVDPSSRALSDGDLYTLLTAGVGDTDMPAYQVALTDQERWDLVAFLREQQSNPPNPEHTPSP